MCIVIRSRTFMAIVALLFSSCSSLAIAQTESTGNPAADIGKALKGLFGGIERAIGSITDQKANPLRALVADGKFEEAAAYYQSNEKELLGSETAKKLLPKIAEELNARLAAGADESASRLAALQSSPPETEWPAVKEQLQSAAQLLSRYDAQPLLAREGLRSPAIGRLAAAHAAAVRRLNEEAVQAFAEYDHLAAPLFFGQYPVDVPRDIRVRIIQEKIEAWLPAVSRGSEAKSQELLREYADAITDTAQRDRIARAFAEAYSREKGMASSPSAAQSLQLNRAVQAAVPNALMQGAKMAIVLIEAAGSPGGRAGWDTQKKGLTVLQATVTELPKMIQDLMRDQGYASVIAIASSAVKIIEVSRGYSMRPSERNVGNRQEPNPEYEPAQQEARRMQEQFADLERQNQDLQRQATDLARQSRGSGLGMFGALLGSSAGTIATGSARSAMEEAQRKASTTPAMISRPVMQAYSYPVVRTERIAKQQVALYVVEDKDGRFKRRIVSRTERRDAEIAHHVDPQDPAKNTIDRNNAQARSRLNELDAMGNLITPEQALDEAGNAAGPQQPIASLPGAARDDTRKYEVETDLESRQGSQASREVDRQVANAAPPPATPVAPDSSRMATAGTGGAARGASMSGANCPRDLSNFGGRMRYSELRTPQVLNQPFEDMIQKAGGVDIAIAAAMAQKKEYENTRDVSRKSALQVTSNPGGIETPCPRPEGMYCSFNFSYHLSKDAIILAQGTIDALSCYKSAGYR